MTRMYQVFLLSLDVRTFNIYISYISYISYGLRVLEISIDRYRR